jgi:hypothetical protein
MTKPKLWQKKTLVDEENVYGRNLHIFDESETVKDQPQVRKGPPPSQKDYSCFQHNQKSREKQGEQALGRYRRKTGQWHQ